MIPLDLPAFSAEQKEFSDQFVERLRAEVLAHGPIPFSEYMQRSLYDTEFGYYVNGFSKLGADGDFVTAPEISNHFAACLAAQCCQVFSALSAQGLSSSVLEFGAGSGKLAADLLLALEKADALPERYFILDVSSDLQQLQAQSLKDALSADIFERIHWLSSLPENYNGVVIANEVLDAFAVERFKIANGVAERAMVAAGPEGFVWQFESHQATAKSVGSIASDLDADFSEGYQSEYCPMLAPWWQALSEMINHGAVIVCDYGAERRRYYSPKASDGTLRCFYRHTVHGDPFARPAVQDITADVDFTAVAIAATEAGLELQGFTPMSQFMLSLGVLERHENTIQSLEERDQIVATSDLKRVILPQEMGDRFMVIGFSKGLEVALDGFSKADWSRLL